MSAKPGACDAHDGGSGTPLVLLHGAAATWRVWRPVLERLEGEHRVRNSLGGWIALELARRGRARSVVALSPAAAWRRRADLERLALQVRAGHAVARALSARPGVAVSPGTRLLLSRVVAHPERVPRSEVVGWMSAAAECTALGKLVTHLRRVGGIAAGLDRIDCPILIVWAGADGTIVFESFGRPLLDRIPTAEHLILPGVGHVPMYDDPELVASTILEATREADRTAKARHAAA